MSHIEEIDIREPAEDDQEAQRDRLAAQAEAEVRKLKDEHGEDAVRDAVVQVSVEPEYHMHLRSTVTVLSQADLEQERAEAERAGIEPATDDEGVPE